MKTITLSQLHSQTVICDYAKWSNDTKRTYTLNGINEWLSQVSTQKDACLYFPISVYIKHDNNIYAAYITKPIIINE